MSTPRAGGAVPFISAPLYSHADFLNFRHFRAFDGVRALAALMVIGFHFGGAKLAFVSGWLGVHLFFVLSGFLITTLLLREEALNGRVSLADFWVRRVFRIFPAYYVMLAATVIVLLAARQASASEVFGSLTYYSTFLPELVSSPYFLHSWTLGVEQKFYLLWPIAGFVLVHVFRHRTLARFVVLAVLGIAALVFPGILIHYVVIGMGCALAIAMNSPRGFRVVGLLAIRWVAALALAALVAYQLLASTVIAATGSQVVGILIYGVFATLALPGLCAMTATTRALSWAPLRFMGERSYSMYLVQFLAATLVTSAIGIPGFGLAKAAIIALFAVGMADLSYRLFEHPAVLMGKRITRRRAQRRVAAVETQVA